MIIPISGLRIVNQTATLVAKWPCVSIFFSVIFLSCDWLRYVQEILFFAECPAQFRQRNIL